MPKLRGSRNLKALNVQQFSACEIQYTMKKPLVTGLKWLSSICTISRIHGLIITSMLSCSHLSISKCRPTYYTDVVVWVLEWATLFHAAFQLFLNQYWCDVLLFQSETVCTNHIKQELPKKCWQQPKLEWRTSRNPFIFTGRLEIPL